MLLTQTIYTKNKTNQYETQSDKSPFHLIYLFNLELIERCKPLDQVSCLLSIVDPTLYSSINLTSIKEIVRVLARRMG